MKPKHKIDLLFWGMVLLLLVIAFLFGGCASSTAAPPVHAAVPMMRTEAEVPPESPQIARISILEIYPDFPVEKRLAVYNADMWDYPYKDWTVQQIPVGEAWENWYATTSTGKCVVEWEYSNSLIYGGVEQSANMKDWYRTFSIDWYVHRFDMETNTRYQKQSFPLVVDPDTGRVDKQFFRLNFIWVDDLSGVQQN